MQLMMNPFATPTASPFEVRPVYRCRTCRGLMVISTNLGTQAITCFSCRGTGFNRKALVDAGIPYEQTLHLISGTYLRLIGDMELEPNPRIHAPKP